MLKTSLESHVSNVVRVAKQKKIQTTQIVESSTIGWLLDNHYLPARGNDLSLYVTLRAIKLEQNN